MDSGTEARGRVYLSIWRPGNKLFIQTKAATLSPPCSRKFATRTTPYHPEGDGMVERFNRTLEVMLWKFVCQHHKDLDVHLPKVMMAYRSSDHASTKFPPFRLMFGRDVRLPLDVMFGRTPDPCDNYGEYVGELI